MKIAICPRERWMLSKLIGQGGDHATKLLNADGKKSRAYRRAMRELGMPGPVEAILTNMDPVPALSHSTTPALFDLSDEATDYLRLLLEIPRLPMADYMIGGIVDQFAEPVDHGTLPAWDRASEDWTVPVALPDEKK